MRNLLSVIFMTLLSQLAIGQITMKISDKQIKKTKIIQRSVDKVWLQWTTHEGLKTFLGVDNKIELTPGGAFEIYFLMDNPVGLRGSEGCKVLSYLPNQMFSFSWNAPPQFKEIRESDYKTWVVVNFESLPNNQTKIVLTHLGWPDDDTWIPVFDYFNIAWGKVLDQLEGN